MHVKKVGGTGGNATQLPSYPLKKFILYSGIDPGWGEEGGGGQEGDPKQLYSDERPLAFFSFPCTGYTCMAN